MKNLILRCGIERAGTGFVDHFLFLNNKIAFFSGPGMHELQDYVANNKGPFELGVLSEVWGDAYQEAEHTKGGLTWVGVKDFREYYLDRIGNRSGNVYAVSHHLGEQWIPFYRDNFDCDTLVVYCARDIIGQYRSFRGWYAQISPNYYLSKLKASLDAVDHLKGISFISLTVPDYTAAELKKRMQKLMRVIGIPYSKEQDLFMGKRRYLGKSKKQKWSDSDLLKELKRHPDFKEINDRYDNLKSGAMDTV